MLPIKMVRNSYSIVGQKKLNSNEYTFDSKLGYISLNQRLNDNQLLAVSYSYTIAGDPKVYKVGEFSEESPVVITKLLKPNNVVKTNFAMWDLMMKNIYSIRCQPSFCREFYVKYLITEIHKVER